MTWSTVRCPTFDGDDATWQDFKAGLEAYTMMNDIDLDASELAPDVSKKLYAALVIACCSDKAKSTKAKRTVLHAAVKNNGLAAWKRLVDAYESNNDTRKLELHRKLVVFEEAKHRGRVIFVSHQWCGYGHPDPSNAQLGCLQRVLQRMIDGDVAQIPPNWFAALAYGEFGSGSGMIPPNADLEFDCELVNVAEGPAAVLAAKLSIGYNLRTAILGLLVLSFILPVVFPDVAWLH